MDLKQKWLEALRSGEYTQGRGMLRNHDQQYCCLGVLCDLVDPAAWEENDCWDEEDEETYAFLHKNRQGGIPDITILELVGINEDDARELASMNDQGDDFKHIANWIQENL